MEYLLRAFDIRLPGVKRAGDACLSAARHLKDHFIPHARNNYHPHVLGNRSLALLSAALVTIKIFSIALLSFGPVVPAFSSAITVENIINLTNNSRKDFNLPALTENLTLNKAAQAKAGDMLAKGYFSHNAPDGKTPWDFISTAGYSYLMAGENLAVNFTQAENVEDAWMNSPGHKANILNKNFEEIGIGIAQGQYQGHNAIFVVQMFGLPAEQKIALTDKPTKVQAAAVPAPGLAPEVRGAAVPVSKLSVAEAQTEIQDGQIAISAKIDGDPVKVIAYFGQRAVMLAPKPDGSWLGQVSLSELAAGNLTVRVRATDMKGQTSDIQLADFANDTVANYNVVNAAEHRDKVQWMGRVFDPKSAEGKFYLFFIAGIITSMIVAIGIKRHVQHLNLIANSSFVVILASLLWMAG